MEAYILDGPRQLREAARAAEGLPASLFKGPDGSGRPFASAMLLGMGGSALSAGLLELLRFAERSDWRFDVVRDYRLPRKPDRSTLLLALSYSGETEETLAAFEEAMAAGSPAVAASRGGRLEEAARRHSVPFVRVPERPADFQPRFALSFMFALAWRILVRAGLLATSTSLDELSDRLAALDLRPQGEELAAWIGERIPVVYVPTEFEAGVARTWRIKFNENAKIPCIAGALPEANHNEMIAFPGTEPPGRFAFLLFDDPDGDERVSVRFRLTGELLSSYGYPVRQLRLDPGVPPVQKALSSLLLADWVTLAHARLHGVDPVSIPAIQEFKQLLRNEPR
ncbi:MAG: hypothetical protein FJ109_01345 [Deltaproteobacteria bacterium]|nr:hypothetical protein [Deltaproteobacteria bacterium]